MFNESVKAIQPKCGLSQLTPNVCYFQLKLDSQSSKMWFERADAYFREPHAGNEPGVLRTCAGKLQGYSGDAQDIDQGYAGA